MNRTQAKEQEGKYVIWDIWSFKPNSVEMSGGSIINSKDVVKSIWILNKLTKGGMCTISQHGSKETISVPPYDLSPWEYPK
jgi:hypothetical protein